MENQNYKIPKYSLQKLIVSLQFSHFKPLISDYYPYIETIVISRSNDCLCYFG